MVASLDRKRLGTNSCGDQDLDLRLTPALDLVLHRLEVPLNAVHSNGKGIDQVEALGVFGQHGVKSPLKAMLKQTKTRRPAVRPRGKNQLCSRCAAGFGELAHESFEIMEPTIGREPMTCDYERAQLCVCCCAI